MDIAGYTFVPSVSLRSMPTEGDGLVYVFSFCLLRLRSRFSYAGPGGILNPARVALWQNSKRRRILAARNSR